MGFKAIAFVAADTQEARQAKARLQARYKHTTPGRTDVIVALGGDGFMLHTLHRYLKLGVPIYGMNRGTVGFLMNEYRATRLVQRLDRAEAVDLHPLHMKARNAKGLVREAIAINEVSLLRQTRLAARITIKVDGVTRLAGMVCDGVLVATAAGSTAYNLSAYGPIVPLGAGLLALTPISAFRPRRWRGALLPHTATIKFDILNADVRPVSAVADFSEVRNVISVTVREDRALSLTLLFDPEHNLEERIVKEQFQP